MSGLRGMEFSGNVHYNVQEGNVRISICMGLRLSLGFICIVDFILSDFLGIEPVTQKNTEDKCKEIAEEVVI